MAKLTTFACPECSVEFTISAADVGEADLVGCPICGEDIEPDDDEDDEDDE